MLVIRLQRAGRKGHAMFRVVVQDSRQAPTSGKVIAWLGSYDPHSKQLTIDKDKAGFFLEHGAQPSDRIARLLQADGMKLPKWVNIAAKKQRDVRNAEKRRSTTPEKPVEKEEPPKDEVQPEAAAEPSVEKEESAAVEEAVTEEKSAPASEEVVTEEPGVEAEEVVDTPPPDPSEEKAEDPKDEPADKAK